MEHNLDEVSCPNQNGKIIKEIHELVRSAKNMKESLPELIEDIKKYFDCEAATIFGVDHSTRQLYSTNYISDKVSEIRVDISLNNLAGYVAGTGSSLNIANVKDKEELAQYHPQLAHGSKWEEILEFISTSMIVVPIPFNKNLIGILEVINKKSDDAFSAQDLKMAQDIAPALGLVLVRFYNDGLQKIHPKQETLSESNDDQTSPTSALAALRSAAKLSPSHRLFFGLGKIHPSSDPQTKYRSRYPRSIVLMGTARLRFVFGCQDSPAMVFARTRIMP